MLRFLFLSKAKGGKISESIFKLAPLTQKKKKNKSLKPYRFHSRLKPSYYDRGFEDEDKLKTSSEIFPSYKNSKVNKPAIFG